MGKYIIEIKYFKHSFDEKKTNYAHTFEEKHALLWCDENEMKFVNFKKLLVQFHMKILKNWCFCSYDNILMAYINFFVHGHMQEFIREIGSCNCFQF